MHSPTKERQLTIIRNEMQRVSDLIESIEQRGDFLSDADDTEWDRWYELCQRHDDLQIMLHTVIQYQWLNGFEVNLGELLDAGPVYHQDITE